MKTKNIEAKYSTWFEVQVKYKSQEKRKKITETYTIEAQSFTEAEGQMVRELRKMSVSDYEVKAIKKAPYNDVYFSKNSDDNKWYKAIVRFDIVNDDTEKLRHSNTVFLIQTKDIATAIRYVNESLNGSAMPYNSIQVTETNIQDCIDYE